MVIFTQIMCTQTKKTELILTSELKKPIDSVVIRTFGVEKVFYRVSAKPQSHIINVNNSNERDGGFTIIVYEKNTIIKSGSFGYFSSKDDIREKYWVNIKADFSIEEKKAL
jgi:hypothetical protein